MVSSILHHNVLKTFNEDIYCRLDYYMMHVEQHIELDGDIFIVLWSFSCAIQSTYDYCMYT